MNSKLSRAKFKPQLNTHKQQGLVLFIALVVLVAMTLAGIAILRQVSGGMGIIGNLAFKENATSAGDLAIETARAWLVNPANANSLINDNVTDGYYSSWAPTFNPATFDWSDSAASNEISDGAGNSVRYVIHRLCNVANTAVTAGGQQCVTLTVEGGNSTKIGLDANTTPLSNTVQPYFRLTSRTTGPRNTLSYVQVIMY
jgi:type IV pilus assembly protein PilX